MTDDRYVIVYRDGSMDEPMCRLDADITIRLYAGEKNPPAYRVRIREKAQIVSLPSGWLLHDARKAAARINYQSPSP